jgi:hypothetical protein
MNLGGIVKKLNVVAVAVAMLFASAAFAGELGGLVRKPKPMQGEKPGSSRGELTQEKTNRVAVATRQATVASNSHGGFRAPTAQAVMKADYVVPPSNEGE